MNMTKTMTKLFALILLVSTGLLSNAYAADEDCIQ